MKARRLRWTHDNDYCFGPFLYSYSTYRNFAIVLSSGGREDDESGCSLRISVGPRTFMVALPQIIRPWRRKVRFTHFTEEQRAAHLARVGRDWYWDVHPREYGFSFTGAGTVGEATFLSVALGAQTHSSDTTQSWSCFLPWTDTRHVRHSLYDLTGDFFATVPEKGNWTDHRELVARCPVMTFAFEDFDGEKLKATTRIEEREWHHGTGWFRWLAWFRKPIIRRGLHIDFSGETGDRKGSWKGGTMGTGINMLPGELHEGAFRRYCELHNMTFKGIANA